MRMTTSFATLLLQAASTLPAQELLYYRFDEADGTVATNYAVGSPAPKEGAITSQLVGAPLASWVPGRFGAALAGGMTTSMTSFTLNYVDSGWVPGTVTGSISYALWVRVAYAQPGMFSYVIGTGTSFRVFTGGTTWFTSGFTGAPTSTTNIYALASQAWTHVAMVADATTMTANYYVNGVPETPRTLTAVPSWSSTSTFLVGRGIAASNAPGSQYHIDEFLLVARALTAAEVQALASKSRAGEAGYGGGCGGLALASTNGLPTVGNVLYQLTLTGPHAQAFAIGFGSNRTSIGTLPLPFDLGLLIGGIGPCNVLSSYDLFTIGGVKPIGTVNVGLPILPDPALGGMTLFLQAPALGGPNPLDLSNAFSIGIGN